MSTANAITHAFTSPNVGDSNCEDANVVDVIHQLAKAAELVAGAIVPPGVAGGRDVHDGHVESLTESVMGVTKSLQNIADAIDNLAEAVREQGGGK